MIIYLIGLVAAIWCVLDIFKKEIPAKCKVGVSILIVLTSWAGMIVYYLFVRERLAEWCNKK